MTLETRPMPLQLVHSVHHPNALDVHPVSRLRYSPRRRATLDDRGPLASQADDTFSATPEADERLAPDEHRLDPAAMLAQAETEDIAFVRFAAGRLAVALREVHVLLGRSPAAWKRDALARCTAKGWIAIQGDPSADLQTFRVTAEGYRAAGLPPPMFSS